MNKFFNILLYEITKYMMLSIIDFKEYEIYMKELSNNI